MQLKLIKFMYKNWQFISGEARGHCYLIIKLFL